MKRHIIVSLLISVLFTGCFDDIGNYDYAELGEITVTDFPTEIEVLSNIDNIVISPKISSSTEGEISGDNPNYTFRYRLGNKGMGYINSSNVWVDLNPDGGLNLDVPANYNAGTYLCWFTVTDKRNDVTSSFFIDVKVSTTTYEGWLVACDEGEDERVRIDMISVLSSTNTVARHDLASGLPEIHHATQLGFHPSEASPGDRLYIFSKEGSYLLDGSTLESGEMNEFNLNGFVTPPGDGTETITGFTSFSQSGSNTYQVRYSFAFSDAGNVYAKDYNSSGAVFELPLNTSAAGMAPEYKVAPFAGFSEVRPGNGNSVLFYDADNKRFVGWTTSDYQKLTPLPDPESGKLFSFQTGKDLVYMENTRRSNGLTYCILQDELGSRSICAINMAGNGFVQEAYYPNINAPEFDQAEHFAFHSQFPIMFYAAGNKLYLYNLGTQTAFEMTNVEFGSSEEITRIKFNLYKNTRLTNLNNQTEEFMNQQYQLIVATYDHSVADYNGGKIGFYEVNATTNSISELKEYSGFAKVKDVIYRER